jgi:hypothetical protein
MAKLGWRIAARRAALGLAAAGLAAIAAVLPTAPAAASSPSFTVTHSATFEVGVASGTFFTIFTDVRVSPDDYHPYPWVDTADGGLEVWASCLDYSDLRQMPIGFVGTSLGVTQINSYLPNSIGPEDFRCADEGKSQIVVRSAEGYPSLVPVDMMTVNGHPGIFAVGSAPAGTHVDGDSRLVTPLSSCNDMLPVDPKACPVRTNGEPAELYVRLTGAEPFLCNPCTGNGITFELAPVHDGVVGTYVPQQLGSLIRIDSDGTPSGVQEAKIYVLGSTEAGEYRLRVRTFTTPNPVQQLQVELGQPS